MAGPKAKTPAPIDRPLSRAYLREFTGWSTAYPPGLSDPTSVRIMENMMVNRDGSLRIRPGLRYLSYTQPPTELVPGLSLGLQPVGTHEAFYLDDGSKAYLFAVRELDGTVGFRVLEFTGGGTVHPVTDYFTVPQGLPVLNLSASTKYVKYLQIDNKIFALSDSQETVRLFTVGEDKSAKRLASILVPDWTVTDKLSIVHPDSAWITGAPTGIRTNRALDPSFEKNFGEWLLNRPDTAATFSTAMPRTGSKSMELKSLPQATNIAPVPLVGITTLADIAGWGSTGSALSSVGISGDYLQATLGGGLGPAGRTGYVIAPRMAVKAGLKYKASMTTTMPPYDTDTWFRVRYYNSSSVEIGSYTDYSVSVGSGRRTQLFDEAPTGAVSMQIMVRIRVNVANNSYFRFKDFTVAKEGDSSNPLSGDLGANYFWTGATNNSPSVYHPPATVSVVSAARPATPGEVQILSAYVRAGSTARTVTVALDYQKALLTPAGTTAGTVSDASGSWTRGDSGASTAPADAAFVQLRFSVAGVARGEVHYIDDVLLEKTATLKAYFSGYDTNTPTVEYTWSGTPETSQSIETTYAVMLAAPPAETPTTKTLISTNAAGFENDFNFGFFYTFDNEVGESAASQVTVIRASRAWSQWRWETPNPAGEPSGTATAFPERAADQLVAIMPETVFNDALAQGALSWSLYMLTWSNQDSVPVEGVKVLTRELTPASEYSKRGWARVSPQSVAGDNAIVPTLNNRRNYSLPSSAGNGLVAADRMILVKDPVDPAVIRYTSNNQGEYTNFTAAKGGGYKTLTSGNLFIPACVKLWQNPQSVDTLTILCQGTDGYSTAYYMQPATINGQSDSTVVMGFEETTATPGTTSPYGVEVFNNALYHPLDEQLMKSTANNYNIAHKSLTDQIENLWTSIQNKQWIVAAQHDNRLYYLVNNPQGVELQPGNTANELWLFDAGSENGTWSRWLIPGHSLRKVEQNGRTYMSVVTADGIYYLDPEYDRDDFVDYDPSNPVLVPQTVQQRFIPWQLETNVQGANRAHDAWAWLQQMHLSLGNFQGGLKWGLRSWDINGKPVLIEKTVRDLNPPDASGLPFDIMDDLLIRRTVQEWFFFASSLEDADGVVERSSGQFNNVQYRYAPSTVNTGYEQGSIETFEYGRETAAYGTTNTDAGVPKPFTDVRRP